MTLRPILDVAAGLGLDDAHVLPYGRGKAKIDPAAFDASKPSNGKLVLVSAMTPTRSGEGKTTMSVGLAMGLHKLGTKSIACLREPSLGPVFGIKGGGTGGGKSQVEPAEDINLHFTGDIHAIGSAHNLLSAIVDNDLHFGAPSGLDSRRVGWGRVLDMNDRALRQVILGLGGRLEGLPRESHFDITAASEVMAVLGLATDLKDLEERLGRIVVGQRDDRSRVTAKDLEANLAMTALLRDALMPNLVQTSDGSPAILHGGPFANIAHGCSSVIGTRLALQLGEVVVTEAGFGFDLGGEKFFDIKCRSANIWPDLVVLVATVRALMAHGDGTLADGFANLDHHLDSVAGFGVRAMVVINVFPDDTEEDLQAVVDYCAARGVVAVPCRSFADGGEGAKDYAEAALEQLKLAEADGPKTAKYTYELGWSYKKKLNAIAKKIYGADGVELSSGARRDLRRFEKAGFKLPVCVAKTPLSISDNAKLQGRPTGHVLHIRDVRLSAGAGFVVALAGDVRTMPGLPRRPASADLRFEDGRIVGLMQAD